MKNKDVLSWSFSTSLSNVAAASSFVDSSAIVNLRFPANSLVTIYGLSFSSIYLDGGSERYDYTPYTIGYMNNIITQQFGDVTQGASSNLSHISGVDQKAFGPVLIRDNQGAMTFTFIISPPGGALVGDDFQVFATLYYSVEDLSNDFLLSEK